MANILSAIGFNPFKKKDDEEKFNFAPPKIQIPQIKIPEQVSGAVKAIGSIPQNVASWLKLDQPVQITQNLPGPVKSVLDPQIKNLRAAGEVLNLPSYLLGGAIKAGREEMQGTYQPPKTGTINIKDIKGKTKPLETGSLIHPVLVGAVRGIGQKQPLFEEVPKTAGIDPNSFPGMAVGLTAEILAPGIGGGEKKAIEEGMGKISKVEELVTALKNTLKIKPIDLGDTYADVTRVALPDAMKALKNFDIDQALLKTFKKGEPLIGDGFTLQAQPKTGELLINIDKSFKDTIPAIKSVVEPIVAKGRASLNKMGKVATKAVEDITPKVEELAAEGADKLNETFVNAEKAAAQLDFNLFDKAKDAVETANIPTVSVDAKELSDITNISKGFKDVFRNFKTVFGPKYEAIKAAVLDPFDAAKGRYVDDTATWLGDLKTSVVDNLGIKKGSKLSELTQKFGEKIISLDELKAMEPKDWEKVVTADDWFRGQYDALLNQVNEARALIYPNNPDKLIPKRADYYRHFQEMAEGFKGALNIFDTPANISPELAGVSPYVKPKSKWLSFAQERLGNKTEYDAVGGFLDYIRSASYAKNIDPQIETFRDLSKQLVQQTSDKADPQTYGMLNNFIEYLDLFANQLSGKTNPLDRAIQSFIPGGRRMMRGLDWLNSRYKANVVLGNVSSSLSQLLNVPAGVADAGLGHTGEALFDMAADIFTKDSPQVASTFLKERYMGKLYQQFDEGLLKAPKKFASWLLNVGDEAGTKLIWNAQYRKALAEGAENAVKFADDATRSIVAGRGIGEVPIAQQAKFTQLLAPFQIEVGNLWWVMKDWVDAKTFSKFVTFFIANHLANNGIEALTGNRPALDPITALGDAAQAYDDEANKKEGIVKAGGRLVGEVLSNMPWGQTIAGLYPEKGMLGLPTKKEFFGEGDPSRFGTGGLPALKAITDPLFYLAPPFAGGQIKKTIQGVDALSQGYTETPKGEVKYPVADSAMNIIRGVLFGPYSFPEAVKYFDEQASPLGVKDTNMYKQLLSQSPEAADNFYNTLMAGREIKSLLNSLDTKRNELKLIMGDPNKSDQDKQKAMQDYQREVDHVMSKVKEKVPQLNTEDVKPLFNPDESAQPGGTSQVPAVLPSITDSGLVKGGGKLKVKGPSAGAAPSVGKGVKLSVKPLRNKARLRKDAAAAIADITPPTVKKPYLPQQAKGVKLSDVRNQRVKLPSLA